MPQQLPRRAGKVQSIVGADADTLLDHKPLLGSLRMWGQWGLVENMNSERGFAAVRRSAPKRCEVERILSASFLSDVRTLHMASGGSYPGVLTREQAVAQGAPLMASTTKYYRKTHMKLGQNSSHYRDIQGLLCIVNEASPDR